MNVEQLIAFNAILGLAILSPGPAFLYILKISLVQGKAAGIAAGLGLGLMASLWTLAALVGLDAVFAVVPQLYVMIKTIGALYLIWLAVGLWRSATPNELDEATPKGGVSPFWGGFFINLANPKSVLFSGSIILVVFPSPLTLTHQIIVPVNHLLFEMVFYVGFVSLISTPRVRAGYLRASGIINRVAGVVMGAFGVKLLLDE